MSLWLNKKEKGYLEKLIQYDLDDDPAYMEKLAGITEEQRENLLKKIKEMKV